MKLKERHLTVTGWVVVGLLDTLAGVISGGLMALWQLPSTYRWRGYWAIGGEWILIVGAIIIASRLMHELQMQALFGGKKKNDKVRSVSQGHYRSSGNRSGVRREVLRQGVRKTAPSTRKAPQNQDCHTAYKECVTDVYGPADEALKGKITDVEAGLKADKEKKVKDYFAEMVKASGVEWVTYEDVGVAVTLTASLKSLKAKVKEYVEKVAADVACINGMENAPEIMAEYKLCGSLAVAINSVSQRKDRVAREEAERKQRLEAQLRAQEAESAVLDAVEEELAAPQVMGTEPPVMDEQEVKETQQESKEQVMTAKFAFMGRTFQCRGTLTQLRELKSFVNEKIDEIHKHMDSVGIENEEVSDNG